jgi:phytoene dehydrogenase-like protein
MNAELDVVIVGGGIGGLAVGALAARRGLSTVVVERAHAPGGRAATTVRDGFHMNLGGHALYRGGPAERVLRNLGVEWTGGAPPTRAIAVIGDEVHLYPMGATSLLRTGLFGARAKLEFGRLLARLPGMDLEPLVSVSLAAWLGAEVRDPRVRAAVETLVRLSTYAHAPDRLSAGAGLAQLRAAANPGVLYVDGGWQTLVAGLEAAVRAARCGLSTNATVESVAPTATGWVVRDSEGGERMAGAVVLAVGPTAAARMVQGPAKAMLEAWAAACVPARAACLDVGLRELPRPDATFALGLDRALYFSVHSRTARLAPRGGAMIHAMKYLAPGDDANPREVTRELEDWIEKLQPGWRDLVVARRAMPDMVASHDIARVGATGSARPGPAVPLAQGLFVVGDWVGGEGMLADGTLASAEVTATLLEGVTTSIRAAE